MTRVEEVYGRVKERLSEEASLRILRLAALDNLQAYWRSFYQAIYIKHPNYIPLMAAFLTDDPEQSGSLVIGSLPLFYSIPPDSREKFSLADYRQLCDQRVAIINVKDGKEFNEGSLMVLLGLEKPKLESLNRDLPLWMNMFLNAASNQQLIDGWKNEVARNPRWTQDSSLEFNRSTLIETMQDLGAEFLIQSGYVKT